jgi:CheY-like chemotaxis protein
MEGEDTGIDSASAYRPGRILLCDDSHSERKLLARFLVDQGYIVEECDSGDAALSFLKAHEIDVLLLDLQMPGTNGFDVLAYLQEHRRGLPVVLLSGMPVDQIQHEIHNLPSRELPPLMLKPVDLDQLVQVLDLQLAGGIPQLPASNDAGDAAV